MDFALLTAFLSPFLPFLIKLSETVSESVAEKFGEDTWNKAKAIWSKLRPEVEANADVRIAVAQVAAKPDSKSRQAVLQEELEALFNENPDLAREIAQLLWEEDPKGRSGTQIIQTVTGNQNQVMGQVSGGQIFGNITGNVVIGGVSNPTGQSPQNGSKLQGTPSLVKTILVLAANPKGTNPLRLGEEIRKIHAGLERSQYRDRIRFEQRWAVTPTDMRRALLDCHPQIVHFSGHGVGAGMANNQQSSTTRKLEPVSGTEAKLEGLVFEDEIGQLKLVPNEALANLFALFVDQVECVVLNACYSVTQADAIAQQIPYVVGMKQAIGDRAAIEFAIGFYDALLAGRDVEFAYKLGCNAIQMAGIPEQLTPALKKK